jgi:hypothetical protein
MQKKPPCRPKLKPFQISTEPDWVTRDRFGANYAQHRPISYSLIMRQVGSNSGFKTCSKISRARNIAANTMVAYSNTIINSSFPGLPNDQAQLSEWIPYVLPEILEF